MSYPAESKAVQIPEQCRHMVIELCHRESSKSTKCFVAASRLEMDFRCEELRMWYCPCDPGDMPAPHNYIKLDEPKYIRAAKARIRCTENIIGLSVLLTEPCRGPGWHEINEYDDQPLRPEKPTNLCTKWLQDANIQTGDEDSAHPAVSLPPCCITHYWKNVKKAESKGGDQYLFVRHKAVSQEGYDAPHEDDRELTPKVSEDLPHSVSTETIDIGEKASFLGCWPFKTRKQARMKRALANKFLLTELQKKQDLTNEEKEQMKRLINDENLHDNCSGEIRRKLVKNKEKCNCDKPECVWCSIGKYLGTVEPTDIIRYPQGKFYADESMQAKESPSTISKTHPTQDISIEKYVAGKANETSKSSSVPSDAKSQEEIPSRATENIEYTSGKRLTGVTEEDKMLPETITVPDQTKVSKGKTTEWSAGKAWGMKKASTEDLVPIDSSQTIKKENNQPKPNQTQNASEVQQNIIDNLGSEKPKAVPETENRESKTPVLNNTPNVGVVKENTNQNAVDDSGLTKPKTISQTVSKENDIPVSKATKNVGEVQPKVRDNLDLAKPQSLPQTLNRESITPESNTRKDISEEQQKVNQKATGNVTSVKPKSILKVQKVDDTVANGQAYGAPKAEKASNIQQTPPPPSNISKIPCSGQGKSNMPGTQHTKAMEQRPCGAKRTRPSSCLSAKQSSQITKPCMADSIQSNQQTRSSRSRKRPCSIQRARSFSSSPTKRDYRHGSSSLKPSCGFPYAQQRGGISQGRGISQMQRFPDRSDFTESADSRNRFGQDSMQSEKISDRSKVISIASSSDTLSVQSGAPSSLKSIPRKVQFDSDIESTKSSYMGDRTLEIPSSSETVDVDDQCRKSYRTLEKHILSDLRVGKPVSSIPKSRQKCPPEKADVSQKQSDVSASCSWQAKEEKVDSKCNERKKKEAEEGVNTCPVKGRKVYQRPLSPRPTMRTLGSVVEMRKEQRLRDRSMPQKSIIRPLEHLRIPQEKEEKRPEIRKFPWEVDDRGKTQKVKPNAEGTKPLMKYSPKKPVMRTLGSVVEMKNERRQKPRKACTCKPVPAEKTPQVIEQKKPESDENSSVLESVPMKNRIPQQPEEESQQTKKKDFCDTKLIPFI